MINFKLKSAKFEFRQDQRKNSTSSAEIKIRVDELQEKREFDMTDKPKYVRFESRQNQGKCSASSAEIKIRIDELLQKWNPIIQTLLQFYVASRVHGKITKSIYHSLYRKLCRGFAPSKNVSFFPLYSKLCRGITLSKNHSLRKKCYKSKYSYMQYEDVQIAPFFRIKNL